MPEQLGTLIKLLAEKSGLDVNSKPVVDLLSINASIGDEAFNAFKTFLDGMLTVESAKNNPTLAAYFKSKVLLPIDSEIDKLVEEFGFDEEQKAAFKEEKSTYTKVRKLAELTRLLEVEKTDLAGKGKSALQDELDKLNVQLANEKLSADARLQAIESSAAQQVLDYAFNSELRGKNYADSIPEAIRITGAKELVHKELAAKGLKVLRTTDDKLKLVTADNPDSTYTENNKEVPFGDFVDKLLASHAMLKVSGPQAPARGVNQIIKPNSTDPKAVDASGIISANEQVIKNLEMSL
jgi:hypothetical protein